MNEQESSERPLDAGTSDYRVLARKYRPQNFSGLIGQQAMVRTLTNAIHQGRLAHAFILTGVRGVGKTTTARIIARVLNCTGSGEGGEQGPAVEPCGECEHCRAIAEDSHMDVLEMDAASRTGIDDIRELLDGVPYRPVSARYKVYIIDEVHMLSPKAFNALLKTLEEPPEHVKFILATTEIRKVPVTVLSRCQRFDLRRVDKETLASHFAEIAVKENVQVADGALQLIARAADGSVRDGLSLLDQAISLAGMSADGGGIDEGQVRSMLGLADRGQTFDLIEAVLKGDLPAALRLLEQLYESGADPVQVIEDMLDLVHWLTRLKVDASIADSLDVPEMERVRGRGMAGRLSMAALARAWQMLLKGLGETRIAPSQLQAAEMVLVRLAYAADLPTPADAVADMDLDAAARPVPAAASSPSPSSTPAAVSTPPVDEQESAPRRAAVAGAEAMPEPEPGTVPDVVAQLPDPASLREVIELTDRRREAILHANLINNLHLVHFEPGRIEFRPGDRAPSELAHDLSQFLNDNTARRWIVTVSSDPGEATIFQLEEAEAARLRAEAAEQPIIREILDAFPGASIEDVRPVPNKEDDN